MPNIVMPSLGEGIEEATVASVTVREGDSVNIDDDVIEVVTDKASFMITSELGGVINKVCVVEGDTVKVGAPLVEVDTWS